MLAREYEMIYIVRPDLEDGDISTIQERTEKAIATEKGTLLKIDDWGKKKLAYEIQKFSKGHFVLVNYLADPEVVAAVERTLRLDDSILRFLTVKLGERVDVDERVAVEEVRQLAAAEVAEAAAATEAAAAQEAASRAPAKETPAKEAPAKKAPAKKAPAVEAAAEAPVAEAAAEAPAAEAAAEVDVENASS
jgi:small subunit ribosomal protein S6